MNKRATSNKNKKKYDDKEDLEIRNVAYYNSASQILLLFILIVLFALTLFCSFFFIGEYYQSKEEAKNGEVIKIVNDKNSALITNNGILKKTFTNSDLGTDNLIIDSNASISLYTKKDATEDGLIKYDVKYKINKNDFPKDVISTTNGEVLVRFSYSYDNENWEYISNVISTGSSNLSPLMGNFYDISGIEGTINVVTDYDLSTKIGEKNTIYWRSETLIKNDEENIDKTIEAEFKIEYKNNA